MREEGIAGLNRTSQDWKGGREGEREKGWEGEKGERGREGWEGGE